MLQSPDLLYAMGIAQGRMRVWSGRSVDLKGGLLLVCCNGLHTPLIHDKMTHPKFR